MPGKRTLGLTIGLVVILVLVPGFSTLVRSCATVNQNVPLRDITELTSKVQLAFPPGCTLAEGVWRNSLTTFGYAKVRFPRDGWREFLAQAPFAGAYQYSAKPVLINPVAQNPNDPDYLARWDLSGIQESVSASGGRLNSDEHTQVGVFIDLTDRAEPIVYLNWYD